MFKNLALFVVFPVVFGNLIIEPKTFYELNLTKEYNNPVNLRLEIKENGIWKTHDSSNHYYLSIILEPYDHDFQWYVPMSLTKYWQNETRLRIVDITNMFKNEFIIFNFEGLEFNQIPNIFTIIGLILIITGVLIVNILGKNN